MAKETLDGKVKKYFANNQSREKVFATSDNFLFERKQDANNHAKTLEDKKVETFAKSSKVEDVVVEDAETVEATKKETTKKKRVTKKKAVEPTPDLNSEGKPKHPATTGADQVTAK